jgi:hypothetical protein
LDATNFVAGSALSLDEFERQMLRDGAFGNDRWALSLLLAKGLVSYRRRYLVFGPRVVRLTPQGRKIRKEL